jgi:CYTH domain-containing protein
MTQHHEIERKFLIKRLHKGWKHHRSIRVVQGYFLVDGNELKISKPVLPAG